MANHRQAPPATRARLGAVLLLAALCACRSGDGGPPAPPSVQASAGQVAPPGARVPLYAAARFADQASFGATPALVAEIQRLGFEGWIDAQFALPPSLVDTTPIQYYDSAVFAQTEAGYRYAIEQLYVSLLASPDQLRRRVSWALSQYLTTSMAKIEPYGGLAWSNFLQRHAFGTYRELIREATINPSMGVYLDNVANRPTSPACPSCALNENYARELLQLFTLGVMRLNPDGTPERDSAGRIRETFTQRDVADTARALSGWTFAGPVNPRDYRRYDGALVPSLSLYGHDRGAKTVLGRSFPEGADARADLDTLVDVLMAHQNVAPFVSLRLIQHLVTSNPSPAYVARVAAVFRNNGQGTAGDMKALVKAVLLDPEARRGDVPGADSPGFGKLREPVLWYTGLLRGMGCSRTLNWEADARRWPIGPESQRPFDAPSVFSYYLPADRAPGSNLLAPEQRLLTASELAFRLGGLGLALRPEFGCDSAPITRALAVSPDAFADLVGQRWFRGAMPALLRQELVTLAASRPHDRSPEHAALLLQFALASPYYGAIR